MNRILEITVSIQCEIEEDHELVARDLSMLSFEALRALLDSFPGSEMRSSGYRIVDDQPNPRRFRRRYSKPDSVPQETWDQMDREQQRRIHRETFYARRRRTTQAEPPAGGKPQ